MLLENFNNVLENTIVLNKIELFVFYSQNKKKFKLILSFSLIHTFVENIITTFTFIVRNFHSKNFIDKR